MGVVGVLALMTFCGCVIDLMSGNFSRAATGGTILAIALIWIICRVTSDLRAEREKLQKNLDEYKRWYPDQPESWARYRISIGMRDEDLRWAFLEDRKKKNDAKIRSEIPGMSESWYKSVVTRDELTPERLEQLRTSADKLKNQKRY